MRHPHSSRLNLETDPYHLHRRRPENNPHPLLTPFAYTRTLPIFPFPNPIRPHSNPPTQNVEQRSYLLLVGHAPSPHQPDAVLHGVDDVADDGDDEEEHDDDDGDDEVALDHFRGVDASPVW